MLGWLFVVALPLLSFFLVFQVVKRLTRGRGKTRGPSATAVDNWVSREVSRLAAQRLGLRHDAVERTVTGAPDPDVVQRLERAIEKVDVVFERVPGRGDREVDVRVEVLFEGGAIDRSLTRVAWAELDESVRAELDQTGASQVFRAWKFAWRS